MKHMETVRRQPAKHSVRFLEKSVYQLHRHGRHEEHKFVKGIFMLPGHVRGWFCHGKSNTN